MGALDKLNQDQDTQNYIIGPGFRVTKAKNKPVEDISTWLQCFAVYVAVMAKQYPEVVGDMMAYMITIMRAQIEFEDPGWRKYDEVYRDKAASTGNRKWSSIDPHFYNQLFTGKAKKVPLCSVCGNTGHTAAICRRKRPSGEPSKGSSDGIKRWARGGNVCWDYNEGIPCQYQPNCRYKHHCAECGEEHPEVQCTKKRGGKGGSKSGEQKWPNGGNGGPGKPAAKPVASGEKVN